MASAIDYLIDFINSKQNEPWLKKVVIKYLNGNEKIGDEELNAIAKEIILDKRSSETLKGKFSTIASKENVKINRIKHISGINALAENQEIYLSDDLTILYGLNGSGKSSYFRIIQGMIGNISHDSIIPNIYSSTHNKIQVSVDYTINGISKNEPLWKNESVISDFYSIKVFNSEYSQSFLEKRLSDEQIVKPYKLYVFSEIISYIEKIKKYAQSEIEDLEAKVKMPNTDLFEENIKILFNNKSINDDDLEKLKDISNNYNKETDKRISELEESIKTLAETNYVDKISLINDNIKDAQKIINRSENILKIIIEKCGRYNDLIKSYNKLKFESINNKKKIEILNNLPGSDSEEWKEFIQHGLKLSGKKGISEKECPFCRRKYDDSAISLIQAYSLFINDKTETNLEKEKKELDSIKNFLQSFEIDYDDYYIENNLQINNIAKLIIDEILNAVNVLKQCKDEYSEIPEITKNISDLLKSLNDYITELDKERKNLDVKSHNKEQELLALKDEFKKLESKKSIAKQITIIEQYYKDLSNINTIKKRVNSLSASKITRMSSAAHENLLTMNLKSEFEKFLKEFDIDNRSIELIKSNSKGKQQTELVMKKRNNVTQILSEGEQKAVSIALFLAEISVAQNESTIIFDDPVNSLDNSMMEKLVNLLMELDNQVIVFTHNMLFRDYLTTTKKGHCCNNNNSSSCNKNGKHIYCYEVQSEGINEAGIIVSKELNTAKHLLDEANKLLSEVPFSENDTVCLKLRKAIDHIIDDKVFNKQIPRAYSMRKLQQGIQWDDLRIMNSNPVMVDDLHRIYDRVSAGGLHLGQVNNTNPPQKSELINLTQQLYNML